MTEKAVSFHSLPQGRGSHSTFIIVPLNKDMTYIDAFFATKDKGGLPSNVLHDDTLQNDGLWEQLKKINYYWAWAKEIIAYPQNHGVFGKGDLKDHEYNWYLASKDVPKAAIGKKGIALSIVPKNLVVSNCITKIVPAKVTVLQKFPQTDGLYGFDRNTRMPIDEKPKGEGYWDARYLCRWNAQSLRPVSRDVYVFGYYGRRGVYCVRRPDVDRLGVWVVEPQAKLEVEQAKLKKKLQEAKKTKKG